MTNPDPVPALCLPEPLHQADSVLRLVANPWGSSWRPLAVGIDTLVCGYHVVALHDSEPTLGALEALREQAQGQYKPVPWEDEALPGMLYPTAGARSGTYRFHLETPIGHVYLRAKPTLDGTPSVLVHFASEALWCQGGPLVLSERMRAWLAAHGLATDFIQPSRIDLAVDVHMPGGITQDAIESHLVTRAKQRCAMKDWVQFKGYAVGSKSSPIFARIYDKSLEIAQASGKYWFWDVWGERLPADVIRIEFQVNRSYLREVVPRIDTLVDLLERLPDLWAYLTTDWMSFRLPSEQRAARRVVLPAWDALSRYGYAGLEGRGERKLLVRDHGLVGSREHLRQQGTAWLVNLGAESGILDPEEAILWGLDDLLQGVDRQDHAERVRAKRIKLGRSLEGLPAPQRRRDRRRKPPTGEAQP